MKTRTLTADEMRSWMAEHLKYETYLTINEAGRVVLCFRITVDDVREDEITLLLNSIGAREIPVAQEQRKAKASEKQT